MVPRSNEISLLSEFNMPAIKETEQPPSVEAIRLALKEAKELANALEGTATTHMLVKAGDLHIEIQREAGVVTSLSSAVELVPRGVEAVSAPAGMVPILAPLVGIFYRAGSPGAKPLVQVGDTVERGQKVGIIEAMKVMNEVTSDCRGVVVEILVQDAAPVVYEQRLMLIDTNTGPSS
jgi:acetyl-CoA carboxylase biotin carboxyl carrier protein